MLYHIVIYVVNKPSPFAITLPPIHYSYLGHSWVCLMKKGTETTVSAALPATASLPPLFSSPTATIA